MKAVFVVVGADSEKRYTYEYDCEEREEGEEKER